MQFGQYILQLRKCRNRACCGQLRVPIYDLLPNGFMPGPLKIDYTYEGPQLADINSGHFAELPLRLVYQKKEPPNFTFDYFCPSVKADIEARKCPCGMYFATKSMLTEHKRAKACLVTPAHAVTIASGFEVEAEEEAEEYFDRSALTDDMGIPFIDFEQDPDRAEFVDV